MKERDIIVVSFFSENMYGVALFLLLSTTKSIPITDGESSSNLRFSRVEGPPCQGGEHRAFLTKNDPVPYEGTDPFQLTLPDGTTESIPVQPAKESRSTGTCEIRDSCELSPTESTNGATGCESEPASVVCCSKTECEAFDGREGICMLDSKCALKEDDLGKYESISDIVYAGTKAGAKGCRHLKDDVRCCVPVSPPSPPPEKQCEDKCDVDDLKMCGSALMSCKGDCTTDPIKCVDCLEEEAAPECCPCIKKEFPSIGAVLCESGPCSKCLGELKACPSCANNAEQCVRCLARKNLGKCCNCARKIYPGIPAEWTCKLSKECSDCANAVEECVTGTQAKCKTGSAIECASCITKANADDCCDCLGQAAETAGSKLPIPCPLPGSCNRCGNAMENCENDCVTSFDLVKCAKCLDDNNGFGCCRCMKDLGVSSLDCAALTGAVNQVKGAVNTATNTVNQINGAANQVKNALNGIP